MTEYFGTSDDIEPEEIIYNAKVDVEDINYCPKCNSLNSYIVKGIVNNIIAEAETTCTKCGHKDFWGYGYFESGVVGADK